jgi:hypothetical protein
MALFKEVFVQEIAALVCQRQKELSGALGIVPVHDGADQLNATAPLRRDLELLMQVTNGEMMRGDASKSMLDSVEEALRRLVGLLFGNVLQSPVNIPANIPDDFWSTDAGILVSRVRWWLSPDELITISNAAALAFGENTQANRMRIARAMEKGLLEWIPDPSVSNPQQNRRVLRSQVERLQEQGREGIPPAPALVRVK